jgi:hypothetical protein
VRPGQQPGRDWFAAGVFVDQASSLNDEINPAISHAIDNRIHWRESAENRIFLEKNDVEEFIAYTMST